MQTTRQRTLNVVMRFILNDLHQKGSDIPRREIYTELRQTWLDTTGNTSAALADILEISAQSCSTLASGTNNRLPAWYLIVKLCKMLNYRIVINHDSVEIVKDQVIEVSEESEEESG